MNTFTEQYLLEEDDITPVCESFGYPDEIDSFWFEDEYQSLGVISCLIKY